MPDGSLPAARRRLADAIAALVDPVMQVVDGRQLFTSSWYVQLGESTSGRRGDGGGSTPVTECFLDALIILMEIDTACAAWCKDGVDTPTRLRALDARAWRPQDCHSIDQISAACEAWKEQIATLLNGPARWSLPYPCPECRATTAHRRDSAGEIVRIAALQIGPDGCLCVACKAAWKPIEFAFLGRLLNCPTPAGMVDTP